MCVCEAEGARLLARRMVRRALPIRATGKVRPALADLDTAFFLEPPRPPLTMMPVCVGDDALPIEHASRPSISIRTRLQRRGLAREDGSPRAPARARRRRGRARAERARPEARPRRGPPDRAASRRPGSPRRRDQANGCRNAEAAAHRTVCVAVAPELALTAARSPECWCMVASVSPLAPEGGCRGCRV